MKQFAILGYPLGHTLSPQLHRLLARELGEQIDYQICPDCARAAGTKIAGALCAGRL